MQPFIKDIFGDKHSKLEPEHHEFRFPGGTVNIQRTSNNEYWVHIGVNRGVVLDDVSSLSKNGQIVDSRVDFDYDATELLGLDNNVQHIPNIEQAEHLAIRITTARPINQ